MQNRWIFKAQDERLAAELSEGLKIHPITARILSGRGIKTATEGKDFLSPALSLLPDPFNLTDMEKAVLRIFNAVRAGEKITVFGDYDADGITATALLVRFLKCYDSRVDYYLPNRLVEGFGLSRVGIETIHSGGSTLIITVDNGTSGSEEIEYAHSKKIDVIVTDHHEISGHLPKAACAIINPMREKEGSPFAELSGAGVAFYLICALRNYFRRKKFSVGPEPNLKSYLDLVAVGTIADVAPLTGVNRILVKNGLEVLKETPNLGLKMLAEISATDLKTLDSYTIPFRLAPRINAAGRLGNQLRGLELLLTDDPDTARRISEELNKFNCERQSIEKRILDSAKEYVEAEKDAPGIVLWNKEWHPGVIGIVASRLVEQYKKPTVLICLSDAVGRGSLRSIGNLNIMAVLEACKETLVDYGGHAKAAGLDIEISRLEDFKATFLGSVRKNMLPEDALPSIEIDAEIRPSDINMGLLKELESLGPFGEGNSVPVFSINGCSAKWPRIVGNNHLKLKLGNEMGEVEAIGFDMGKVQMDPNGKYRFAGTLQTNTYNGNTTPQFKLVDIKI